MSAFTPPVLKPTSVADETFAGVTYHLAGELVPALTINITPDQPIYFEHHIMLWKTTSVKIGLKAMKGALKRMMAGMQIFVTEAHGDGQIAMSRDGVGQIAMSRDGVGQIVPLHLRAGDEVHVREHQFLAASKNIEYSFQRVKGLSNILAGNSGFFLDKFHCRQGEGIVWLHGYGNVFDKVLQPGEQIEVEPGAWLYKGASVRMETNVQRISSGLLGGMNFLTNRFTGPGRIGIQSMYMGYPTED